MASVNHIGSDMTGDNLLDKFLTVVISAGVGFLISSVTKVSNSQLNKTIAELEKRVVTPIVERVNKLEIKADGYVTRMEVKEQISELRTSVKDQISDLKTTMDSRLVEVRGMLREVIGDTRVMRRHIVDAPSRDHEG
jgi:hypothetical protein